MNKSKEFEENQKELARFARVISHPARLAILQYLSETKSCISGDISDSLPLSRSTVSQHLKELRSIGLIHGEIEGLKINYCLCSTEIERWMELFAEFFEPVRNADVTCETVAKPIAAVVLPEKKAREVAPKEEPPDKSKDIFFF
jgi:ArsR family transcriptional regulator, arsenate/arsenite/antimonite-responsive transcriptional repressor